MAKPPPYHGTFGFYKSPAEIVALMVPTLSKAGYHVASQSEELAVFTRAPSSTANVLIFGLFAKTKSDAISMSFERQADGMTRVSIHAENGRLGRLFEELREVSAIGPDVGSPAASPPVTPPGWYRDPDDVAGRTLRYWDGSQWTEHRHQSS